jgi:hypothetical protein
MIGYGEPDGAGGCLEVDSRRGGVDNFCRQFTNETLELNSFRRSSVREIHAFTNVQPWGDRAEMAKVLGRE